LATNKFSGVTVASIQPKTHSFIVKVWLDETDHEPRRRRWRGRVTHIPSGHDCHFVELNEIAFFIIPYLQQLGIKPGWLWRVRQWLRW
jgi:hypothetical protein